MTSLIKSDHIKLERNPKLWGSHLWAILHWMTHVYPQHPSKNDEFEYSFFFEQIIPVIIPCKKCVLNYKNHILSLPINLKNRDSLVLWLCKIHNKTNKCLDKDIHNCDSLMSTTNIKKVKRRFDVSLIQFNLFMRDHVNCGTTHYVQNYANFLRFIYKYNVF